MFFTVFIVMLFDVFTVFIVTLLDGDSVSAWLGLQRREDGSFAWVDNSEITFTRWDDNEPSGGMVTVITSPLPSC